MPIPNVSTLYQKIHKGSEGGHEFSRFIKLLLNANYSRQNIRFISESDASGDYKKVDAYIPGGEDFPNLIEGFQFKFFPCNLSKGQKYEVIKSIEGALEENEYIQKFVLITPEDFQKEQQLWFDELRKKYEQSYWVSSNGISRKSSFQLIHWGHSKIIELVLKFDYIGSQYFPELFPAGVGKFKLSKAIIDSSACYWLPSKHNVNGYYQISGNDLSKTSDPVFDFHFKNSTLEIHLLENIEIHIEEVWTTLKGFPKKQLLKSIGTIEHEIDFNQKINIIKFSDPVIFESQSAKRFKIQLKEFSDKCPGNWVKLKFWFFFDEVTIPTDSFIFSI